MKIQVPVEILVMCVQAILPTPLQWSRCGPRGLAQEPHVPVNTAVEPWTHSIGSTRQSEIIHEFIHAKMFHEN